MSRNFVANFVIFKMTIMTRRLQLHLIHMWLQDEEEDLAVVADAGLRQRWEDLERCLPCVVRCPAKHMAILKGKIIKKDMSVSNHKEHKEDT